MANQLAITGATIIDGNGGKPLENGVIVVEGARIAAVGDRAMPVPPQARKIDARGKFVIPGLMNANVHLFCATQIEHLARYWGRYEEIIEESAQVALKNGLTTVFDTWGPRRFLMNVRDRINKGEVQGSRIFCAGNIVGFDGLFSVDFLGDAATSVASAAFARRINAIWTENVGRHLMWLTPEEIAKEVGAYIGKGIDFIKYAANEHGGQSIGAFLAFSNEGQAAICAEAHRAGVSAQAHTMSVEGLRMAIEAGCDLITHCNITGPRPIPPSTIELFAKRNVGAVIFALTESGAKWAQKHHTDMLRAMWGGSDINTHNLIASDAPLLFANDGGVFAQEEVGNASLSGFREAMCSEEGGGLFNLADGHFGFFRAMEEKGCPPMRMLQAATKNIAVAYGKDKDVGTLEAGKFADLVILDRNPLAAAANYRSIHTIIKDGAVVDREALPVKPVLTAPVEPPAEEEAVYKPFVSARKFPMCPMCMRV